MVWPPKKGRRTNGSKSTVSANGSTSSRKIKSCLKYDGIDATQIVSEGSARFPPSVGDSSSAARDHSTRSGPSILSVSTRSRDTALSEDHPRSNASGGSGDSRTSTGKGSQYGPLHGNIAPADKKVAFGNIHIREHERVVGDNPSCSTGPPIAIGWGHGDTRVLQLDDYERTRPKYRRKRNVLTRAEREEILLNWGISFNDIIDAIRANIKIKNQRRQTVTNLGKVERIEEAFESATRKLKRALLLRRRTGNKVKQLQEQADVAAQTLEQLKSAEHRMVNSFRVDETLVEIEPDENGLDDLEQLQVSVSEFCKVPSESKLVLATSSISDIDDCRTSIGGFSLGNSTSASVLEMERFYRELELEMFGDMPLPDMVGETLEVPDVQIPEEERVYHDPPSVSGLQEPPSITPSYAQMLDERKEFISENLLMGPVKDIQQTPTNVSFKSSPSRPRFNTPQSGHLESSESMAQSFLVGSLHRGNTDDIPSLPRQIVRFAEPEPTIPPYPHMPAPPGTCLFLDDPITAIRTGQAGPPHLRLSTSIDSTDSENVDQHRANMARAYLSHTVTEMEQRYLHPSLAPPPPPPNQFGVTFYPADAYDYGGAVSIHDGPRREQDYSHSGHPHRSSHRKDGPEVRHIPPFTSLSPTHWMEGDEEDEEGPIITHHHYEPITISEDGGSGLTSHFSEGGDVRSRYVVPQRFPASFF